MGGRFIKKPLMAGETASQCCASRVAPSTPPSVTPETEWMLYSPKARIPLPSRAPAVFVRMLFRRNDLPPFAV